MFIPIENEYIVVGDVHGCIDELQLLLVQNGFKIDSKGIIDASSSDKSIILLGDFIDKANDIKLAQTINFIYTNFYNFNRDTQRFYLILGNHEAMVYRYIQQDPKLDNPKDLEKKIKYYNTALLLEKDSDLKQKFLELYNSTTVWLKYNYSKNFSVIFTHAPCEERYLAKNDEKSLRNMIKSKSRSKNSGIKLDTLLPYLIEEAKDNEHYHIFGHLSQPNIRKYKNKICIDTSAIYGNSLSCAIIKKSKISYDSVKFQEKQQPSTQIYNTLFDF